MLEGSTEELGWFPNASSTIENGIVKHSTVVRQQMSPRQRQWKHEWGRENSRIGKES